MRTLKTQEWKTQDCDKYDSGKAGLENAGPDFAGTQSMEREMDKSKCTTFLRYMGVPRYKSRSCDPGRDIYWPNLHSLIFGPLAIYNAYNRRFGDVMHK